MLSVVPFRTPLCLLTVLLLAGCGGGAGKDESHDEADAEAAGEAPAPAPDAGQSGTPSTARTPAGARAAGVDEERYSVVRSDLSAAASYLTPYLGGIDTAMLSPAQREEMRQMNAAQLRQMEGRVPADVVEALKPRAEALRKKDLELAGARLKGAGM